MSDPVPGWHPDPEQPGQQRFWDGVQWTEHRAPLVLPGQDPNVPAATANPRRGLWIALGSVGAVLLVLIAIGAAAAGRKTPVAPRSTTSTTEAATTSSVAATTLAPTTTVLALPASISPPITPAPTNPPTTGPPASGPPNHLMPSIPCGTDLQLAQDRVQAEAGIFKSRSEDATGQRRFQVIDSNWTVVRQSPAAGTPIAENEAVFSVVKDEEFTQSLCAR